MRIAVVGSYGVGMTIRVPKVPQPGETVLGGRFLMGPGGKGSNQAIAAARLGAQVSLLSAVGDDAFGIEAKHLWTTNGINHSCVVTGSAPTMVGVILLDEAGENRIVIAPGVLEELRPAHVEGFRGQIREADLVMVSMEIPHDVVWGALRIAREESTKTLLNPAPAAIIPDDVWPLIDYITPNRSEAPVILGVDDHGLDEHELVSLIRERTAATIVLTSGSRGCLYNDGAKTVEIAAIAAAQIVDTTGAGDGFSAALAVALVDGLPLEQAVRFAAAAGSHVVTIDGVVDALPTRDEIDKLMGQLQ